MCKYDVNGIITWNVCVVHMISKLNSLKELNTCYLLAQDLSWGSSQAFVWLGNLWRLSLLNLSSLTWLYSWSLSSCFCGPLQGASLVEAAVFSQNEWFRKALAPMKSSESIFRCYMSSLLYLLSLTGQPCDRLRENYTGVGISGDSIHLKAGYHTH